MKGNFMKAKDLDKIFDEGEVDIMDFVEIQKGFRPGYEQKRVNVDFPVWMVDQLDKASLKLGVPRQSLIKVWLAERLNQEKTRPSKRRAQRTVARS